MEVKTSLMSNTNFYHIYEKPFHQMYIIVKDNDDYTEE